MNNALGTSISEAIVTVRRSPNRCDTFRVPCVPGTSVLWLMTYIYEHLDSSLAYPLCLCRIGRCGLCAVRRDGEPVLACTSMVEPGEELTIEPLTDKAVIRDLVAARHPK